MLRQSHIRIGRHNPLPQTEIAKKGKVINPSPFSYAKNRSKVEYPYLVFDSSFFSGAGAASFMGSPGFCSPAGGAAGSAGAVGAGAGGGGGGAGSSFLPHPTNVRVNAKRVIADNETSFFPILIHLLSRHPCKNFLSVKHFVSHKSGGVSSAGGGKNGLAAGGFFLGLAP